MTINRGLDKIWYMPIVEYNVAVKNNTDLYVIIHKDYIMFLEKLIIEQYIESVIPLL